LALAQRMARMRLGVCVPGGCPGRRSPWWTRSTGRFGGPVGRCRESRNIRLLASRGSPARGRALTWLFSRRPRGGCRGVPCDAKTLAGATGMMRQNCRALAGGGLLGEASTHAQPETSNRRRDSKNHSQAHISTAVVFRPRRKASGAAPVQR
jgi:hypothetical protein